MVGWAGLPPSAGQLLEPVSESTSQGSRPIEPIAWTADLARANGAVKGSTFAKSRHFGVDGAKAAAGAASTL